ncbi:MAG: MBL fold metallo-hydrolase [Anaerolineales bacterium]|jgi:ribonuclease Z
MAKLIILGSSSAIPSAEHENTHMALAGVEGAVLVDCVGTPIVRLEQAGLTLDSISDLILTHFHPDHVSGVPLLLMNMWLLGRQEPLGIHGYQHCLDCLQTMMGCYQWETWAEMFQVGLQVLPEQERVCVLEREEYRIEASPMRHLVPTLGIRIQSTTGGRSIVYSSDTEPCPSLLRLAEGADILIHESTGKAPGHSSARQVGETARRAGVGRLLLIHYPGGVSTEKGMLKEARSAFKGEVALAQDWMEIEL